jgi:aryl-alcohol dehydrogenase-like predicted oxidoreductase
MFGELDVLSYGTWVNEKFLGQWLRKTKEMEFPVVYSFVLS